MTVPTRTAGAGWFFRRGLWIGLNLVVGYFTTLLTFLAHIVWSDDDFSTVPQRTVVTVVCGGLLIGVGAALNGLLRLLNRGDIARRRFWTVSAAAFLAWSVYYLVVVALLHQYKLFPG